MLNESLAPYGATKMKTRDQHENVGRNYVPQPYPAVRYHPDGRVEVVKDEAADLALGKEWGSKPLPPVPVVVPPPEPTAAELLALVAELTEANAKLTAELAELKAPKKSKAGKTE